MRARRGENRDIGMSQRYLPPLAKPPFTLAALHDPALEDADLRLPSLSPKGGVAKGGVAKVG